MSTGNHKHKIIKGLKIKEGLFLITDTHLIKSDLKGKYFLL
jgi:hypothetical protein